MSASAFDSRAFVVRGQAFLVIAALLAQIFAASAIAQTTTGTVDVQVSSREVFIDVPFTLRIEIRYDKSYQPPTLESLDGIAVKSESNPMHGSYSRTMFGRTESYRTATYQYELVAARTGTLEIPEFEIVIDGERRLTDPITIRATDVPESDVVEAELIAPRERFYVGERFDVTLQIRVIPFVNPDTNNRRSLHDTWRDDLNISGSELSVFATREVNVSGEAEWRKGVDGQSHLYYVYSATVSLRPQRAGVIDFDDLRIVMDYPVRVRERFGGQIMQPVERRVVVARPEPLRLDVRPLPIQGRPEGFSGAIGQYDFQIRAQPTEAAVGEPITLAMFVIDRTEGGGTLDAAQAPHLENVKPLVDDFRVPAERLAGDIDGNRKIFRQSIRARAQDVDAIPRIPFIYFDPTSGGYVTVYSDPIPLEISPGSSVDLEAVVGGPDIDDEEVSGASRPEVRGDVRVGAGEISDRAVFATWWIAAAFGAPPLAFLGVTLVATRRGAPPERDRRRRERNARRNARRILASSDQTPARRAHEAIVAYLVDRLNIPVGAVTSVEVRRHLLELDFDEPLADRAATFLHACETAIYANGGMAETSSGGFVDESRSLIDDFDRAEARKQ